MIDWEQKLSVGRRLVAASRLLNAAQEHAKKKHIRWFIDQALRAIHGKHYEEYIEDFEEELVLGQYDYGKSPRPPEIIYQELGFYELFARQRDSEPKHYRFRSARRP